MVMEEWEIMKFILRGKVDVEEIVILFEWRRDNWRLLE